VASGTACPDDGRECTYDRCDGAGACTHPNKPSGTACTSDGNNCTRDGCNSSGACAHTNLADGTSCGTTWQKCCSGVCRNLSTDEGNCAGCGLSCYTGYNCLIPSGYSHPTCDCGAANAQCHGGSGQLCSTTYGVCACTSSSGCASGQTCMDITGPNYCTY
jgi:hypothetical protein